MTVAVNDLFRIAAVGSAFGQRIMLTHAYQVVGIDPNQSELTVTTAILEALRGGGGGDLFETEYLACLPVDYTLDYWYAQKVAPVRYRYAKHTRGVTGTHADGCETANQAAVLTGTTVLSGRSQISNKHIGPIPQSANVQANGLVAAAYKAKLSALGAKMDNGLVDAAIGLSMFPVIIHPTPATSSTLIIDFQPQDTIRVMRRRTVGLGI